MEIRTFQATTMVDALDLVRQEFGDDAVILSTGRSSDVDPTHAFEVTAALPAANPRRAKKREARVWQPPQLDSKSLAKHRRGNQAPVEPRRDAAQEVKQSKRPVAMNSAPTESPRPTPEVSVTAPVEPKLSLRASEDFVDLQRGVLALQKDLKDVSRQVRFGSGRGLTLENERLVERLQNTGMPRILACALADELPSADCLESERKSALDQAIARRLNCAGLPQVGASKSLRLAFVGPTGVGKTTLIAKLLLQANLFSAKRVGMISLDTRRVAAVEQTRRIASLTRSQLELIYRSSDLEPALERLSSCDLILIDTPGAGPADRLSRERSAALLKVLAPQETQLVLPASLRLQEQQSIAKLFANLGVSRLSLTKLDESCSPGALLETVLELDLPLALLSTGQRIPDAVRLAEATSLSKWIQTGAWSA
jgi:flagellar biosynthesis protein FlhF